MNEVKHFTKTLEIKHFAEVKVSPHDNVYGVTWANLVKEYLKTAYSLEDAEVEIQSFGKTYKVLKRTDVTVFYDQDGNTLFDVTNERLEDEYEWLSKSGENQAEPQTDIKKTEKAASYGGDERTEDAENMVYMGKTSLADAITGNIPKPTEEELANAKEKYGTMEEAFSEELENEVEGDEETQEISEEDSKEKDEKSEEVASEGSVYIGVVGAVTKLQQELKKAKNKAFAEPIIAYLIERCKESESLANDICQSHKAWEKCYNYIHDQARKELKGTSGAIRDNVVFEWAEDYFHKDDKAEEEKKAKAEAERKKKAAEAKKADPKTEKKSETPKPVPAPKAEPKPEKSKKSSKDMDGQMDLFSMMGM